MAKKSEEMLQEALRLPADQRAAALNNVRNQLRAENGMGPDNGQAGQTGVSPTEGYLQYLDAYKNNQFNYDLYADPIYQQARDAAMRQGQLASKNVQAQAATLTGGYGNSYGTMAAGQAYNQYLQSVDQMAPELEQEAYNRYQDEQNKNLTLTQMYMQMEDRDYNREMNKAQLAAQYGDYGGLNALGINTGEYESREQADREWEELQRKHTEHEWEQADEAYAWQLALQAAQYGDYTKLESLGLDMSSQRQKDLLERAIQFAQFYDYSLLKQLGVNTDLLEAQKAATWASLYGTGSGGGSGTKPKSNNPGPGTEDAGGDDELGFDLEAYKRNLLNINPNNPSDTNFKGRGLTYIDHTVSNGVATIKCADANRKVWIIKLDAQTGDEISVTDTNIPYKKSTGA